MNREELIEKMLNVVGGIWTIDKQMSAALDVAVGELLKEPMSAK